jgi:phosphate acetyltransferase/phosphate butyryltransferase
MRGLTIGDIAVGDAAEVTHTITVESIREFVVASGDDNPIHSDPAFAADTRFGRVIAPGMLTGSFVSAVIGTRLPGPGTIYLSQDFRFLRPVYIGDRVTARVEVAERLEARNRLRLRTTCVNQAGELVLEGDAWVLPSTTPIEYARGPRSRRPAAPLAFAPAAVAVELASLWIAGGLALTSQALQLGRAFAPQPAAPASHPPDPDPIRP